MLCARIFTFLSFLQSQFVNHVFKLLQRLGDFVPPDSIPELRPWTPLGDFRPPDPLAVTPPKIKIPGSATGSGVSVVSESHRKRSNNDPSTRSAVVNEEM